MRRVRIEDVLLGERVGKAIFSPDGKILLSQGVEIAESYLDRLKEYGITEIYIEDEISNGIELHETIADNTRIEAKSLVKDLIEKYQFTYNFNSDNVIAVVDKIILLIALALLIAKLHGPVLLRRVLSVVAHG
jgi:hypothetical protein